MNVLMGEDSLTLFVDTDGNEATVIASRGKHLSGRGAEGALT